MDCHSSECFALASASGGGRLRVDLQRARKQNDAGRRGAAVEKLLTVSEPGPGARPLSGYLTAIQAPLLKGRNLTKGSVALTQN